MGKVQSIETIHFSVVTFTISSSSTLLALQSTIFLSRIEDKIADFQIFAVCDFKEKLVFNYRLSHVVTQHDLSN